MADLDFTLNYVISTGAPYSISKAALNMLIVKYHNAYQAEGILFMGISPGLVATAENKTCKFLSSCLPLRFVFLDYFLVFLVLLSSPSYGENQISNPPIDTPDELEGFKQMIGAFKAYAPTFEGPITPQQSVEMVLKVIDEATLEKNGGSFVSHYGNKQWL